MREELERQGGNEGRKGFDDALKQELTAHMNSLKKEPNGGMRRKSYRTAKQRRWTERGSAFTEVSSLLCPSKGGGVRVRYP